MRKAARLSIVLLGISITGICYAQPKIPGESLPPNTPPRVKAQIERLYSPDARQRAYGAYYLGRMGESAAPAVSFLVAMLHDEAVIKGRLPFVSADSDDGPTPGREAQKALGQIGKSAVDALIAALKDKDSMIRSRAAIALGEIKDPRAVEPLIAALGDRKPGVRMMAAMALGQTQDARAVEPLLAAAKQDRDREVRAVAVACLGMTGKSEAVEPLIAILRDKRSDMRGMAAMGLGMLSVAGHETDEPDPRCVQPLIDALKDANPGVRMGAAWALMMYKKEPPVVEALMEAARDREKGVRLAALLSLGLGGEPRPVELFLRALRDREPGVRVLALQSLAAIKDPRRVEPMIAALRDEDPHVRAMAAQAVAHVEDPRVVEPLIAALKDEDVVVRTFTAAALGRTRDPRALAPLVGALKDERACIRASAAEGLGELGDARAVDALIAVLRDESAFVRRGAAGPADLRFELKYRLVEGRPDEYAGFTLSYEVTNVRRAAAQALKQITGADRGTNPDAWQEWWQQNKAGFGHTAR